MANCDPEFIAQQAKCFQCYDDKERRMVETYLLAQISNTLAGTSTDPGTLLKAAAQFQGVSEKGLVQIQDYLLCQIAG
jgi:hypothetical protein